MRFASLERARLCQIEVGFGVVPGAVTDVQAGHDARRHPAAPPEKAVRNSRERPRADDLDFVTQGCG